MSPTFSISTICSLITATILDPILLFKLVMAVIHLVDGLQQGNLVDLSLFRRSSFVLDFPIVNPVVVLIRCGMEQGGLDLHLIATSSKLECEVGRFSYCFQSNADHRVSMVNTSCSAELESMRSYHHRWSSTYSPSYRNPPLGAHGDLSFQDLKTLTWVRSRMLPMRLSTPNRRRPDLTSAEVHLQIEVPLPVTVSTPRANTMA